MTSIVEFQSINAFDPPPTTRFLDKNNFRALGIFTQTMTTNSKDFITFESKTNLFYTKLKNIIEEAFYTEIMHLPKKREMLSEA